MQPNVENITVTPEQAHEWLGYNTHNRRLRQRVVSGFATDMRNGDWHWNGETIKFAVDGTLLDGQHRLAAVVESGAAVSLLVVRGLPNQAQETMDGGVKRRFSDVLQLRGESSYTTLAAITRRVTIWETGARAHANDTATNAQMLATLEKYPQLREHALAADHVAARCALPGSIVGWAMWLFHQLDAEDANHFFERLASDERHVSGEPIYELRKAAENSKTVKGSRSLSYLSAIIIKAWNVYRDGGQIGLLTYRPGGAKPERFPEPR